MLSAGPQQTANGEAADEQGHSGSLAACPIHWPLVGFRVHLGFIHAGWSLPAVSRIPGEGRTFAIFPNIFTLSMSIRLHLQVSSSMETTRAWASIRLNYFSNHITFGRLPFAKPKHLQLRNATSKFKNFAKKCISSHRSGWWQSSKNYCCE